MHLTNSADAINKLVMALKPYRYIMLEEPDFSTFLAEGKPQDGLTSVHNAFSEIETAISSKQMNLYLGKKIPQLLANLGFKNITIDEKCTIESGGTVTASIHRKGWSILMKQGLVGNLTEEEYMSAMAYMKDPNFSFKNSTNVGVWACKPATELTL